MDLLYTAKYFSQGQLLVNVLPLLKDLRPFQAKFTIFSKLEVLLLNKGLIQMPMKSFLAYIECIKFTKKEIM